MTTELKLPDFESWTDAQIDAFTDKVIEALDKLPEEGVPGHVYSREEVETLYAAGYQLYRQGDLKNSTAIFQYLCIYESDDARFWTALAVAMQKQKKWDPAIDAYSMAALLDATNVSLYLYATECLMASRQWSRAKQSLDAFFYRVRQRARRWRQTRGAPAHRQGGSLERRNQVKTCRRR